MPCEMRLCKFFHKLQNAHHTSRPESGGPEPTLRAVQISVDSPQQSLDTVPIYLDSMSSQQRHFTPYRGPLPDPLEFQQPASYSRNPPQSRRPPRPLVDLSSLEGPPITNKRGTSTRTSRIPRIEVDQAAPNNARLNLRWKPLPPRPASSEPTFPRQQPMPCKPHSHSNRIGTHLRNDTVFTQSPAQRGRPIHIEEERQRNRLSPDFAALRSTSVAIPRHSQFLRSQSFDSIVWHESRGQWVVVDSSTALSAQSHTHCLPTRLRNATSPTLERHRDRDDEVEDHDPPDYESHDFSPTHVMRHTFGSALRTKASERETS